MCKKCSPCEDLQVVAAEVAVRRRLEVARAVEVQVAGDQSWTGNPHGNGREQCPVKDK
jgi:hypothetical protein